MSNLPLHGVAETLLDPELPQALADLEAARAAPDAQRAGRLREVVAATPTFMAGWAALAAEARRQQDPVAAYAFARTGYHRGLDGIRRAGWRGSGPVPWHHEPNRGFLASLYQLMLAAAAIREDDEARRCRDFLLELDPADAQGVRGTELP